MLSISFQTNACASWQELWGYRPSVSIKRIIGVKRVVVAGPSHFGEQVAGIATTVDGYWL